MKYKYKLSLFVGIDPKAIETELNNMSANGYELVEIGPIFMTFKKSKPNSKKYAVVIHEEAIGFESGVDEFDEFCLEAGWVKVAKNGSVLIYENDNLNAIHISTDVEVEYTNVRRYMKQSTLIQGVFLAGASYFMWYLAFSKALIDRLDFLSDYLVMLGSVIVLTLFLFLTVNVVLGICWIMKSDKLMKISNQYVSIKNYSKIINVECCLFLAIFICFILVMFVTKNYLLAIHYISYFLFIFVITTFSNGVMNRMERELPEEQKVRKKILGVIKFVVLVAAIIIYIVTPQRQDTKESEGTIWLYKTQDILWEGDCYVYELYYPKNEKVYDYVLNYLESNNKYEKIIYEKYGNIFVIAKDTPPEYQAKILENTVNF